MVTESSVSATNSATELVTHSNSALSTSSTTATNNIMMTSDPTVTSNSMINTSPTNDINFMTSSSIVVMVTTPSVDARQEQNDGSDVGGIVAGCVVAFILIIAIVVCLIIFLMWYRAKKKGEYTAKSGIALFSYSAIKYFTDI